MEAFVTGSYCYGVPTKRSDIDLVVFVSMKDMILLRKVAFMDPCNQDTELEGLYKKVGGMPLRFGRLNLLVVWNKKQYELWKKGTELLSEIAPVTRKSACILFRSLGIKGY